MQDKVVNILEYSVKRIVLPVDTFIHAMNGVTI
jgi:hypothetical protein